MSTKDLARHLGLLKRRSSTLGQATKENKHQIKRKKQIYDFIIILDFESTCWKDRSNGFMNEIIEFPAVLLDLSNGEIVDKFQQYVKPSQHKILSDFCKQLTGITQEQVDSGVSIRQCLQLFDGWVKKVMVERNITFKLHPTSTSTNSTLIAKKCVFATWTDWDLNVCLKYECKRKAIPYASYLKCWIDLKKTYKDFYDRPPKGLSNAMEELGLHFKGRQHSGIDDATNTGYLCWRMVKDGCFLAVTKSILLNPNDDVNRIITHQPKGIADKTKDCRQTKLNFHTPKAVDEGIQQQKENDRIKITPPLCNCGRRCKRKRVMNPGPNIDRVFYACPVNRETGCKYFKWEEKLGQEIEHCFVGNGDSRQNMGIKFSSTKNRGSLKGVCSNLFRT